MLAFPLPRRSFASSLNKFPTPTQTFASGSKQPLLQWNTKRVSYFSTSSETPSTPPPSSPPSPPSPPSSLPPATTEKPEEEKKNMFPKELVKELNRFIVGQEEAKIAIANAFRNRWRRLRVPQPLRDEIVPKNILMVGPTGVGKTEIARRMAKLTDAPFIKVEATKFTEVGYVGKDVDTIIRDLVDIAVNQAKQKMRKKLRPALEQAVEDKILEILTGEDPRSATRELFRDQLRSGALDSQIIEIETKGPSPNFKVDEGSSPVNFVMKMPVVKKKMTVKESRAALEEQELEKRFNSEAAVQQALVSVQEEGIVFIDEIDKVCTPTSQMRHSDASAEGVQRDLLPLIEGTTINTKYGNVDTSKILFVASGAFHSCKPSDLLAELQGRLPIRVELKGLSEKDLFRILREPETNLLRQQQLMMEVEKIQLTFTDEAVTEIARFSAQLNSTIENIGARRLHMVLEKIMEQVSFDCETPREVVIDLQYVQNALSPLMQKIDLTKYLL